MLCFYILQFGIDSVGFDEHRVSVGGGMLFSGLDAPEVRVFGGWRKGEWGDGNWF